MLRRPAALALAVALAACSKKPVPGEPSAATGSPSAAAPAAAYVSAANAKRRIEPGTLLLVVKSRPPFSEVNVSSGPNAWVLSARLATGEREVSVAKLAEKARFLERSGKHDEAKQILALARDHFAGSPLVDALAADLGETSPGVAAVVPASAPGDVQPGGPPPR